MDSFCSLSDGRHSLKNPVPLECDHLACFECFNGFHQSKIRCVKCGVFTIRNRNETYLPRLNENNDLNEMFHKLGELFERSLASLKENVYNINANHEPYFEYFKEEVEIRIESLKCELDKFKKIFDDKIEKLKTNVIQKKRSVLGAENQVESFSNDLEKLKDDKINKQTTESYHDHAGQLSKLNTLIENLDNVQCKISYKSSSMKLDCNLIGRLVFNKNRVNIEEHGTLIKVLVAPKCSTVSIKGIVNSMCALANGTLLVSDWKNSHIAIYDKDFDLIKICTKLDDAKLGCCYVATNTHEHVYVSDSTYHRVVVTDLNLELLMRIDIGSSRGLCQPSGISHYKNVLYVCDSGHSRILRIDSLTLTLIDFIPLAYKPEQAEATHSRLIVKSEFPYNIHFHLHNQRFENHLQIRVDDIALNRLGRFIYTYSDDQKTFRVYDEEGNLVNEIIRTFSESDQCDSGILSGSICSFDNRIIMPYKFSPHLMIIDGYVC